MKFILIAMFLVFVQGICRAQSVVDQAQILQNCIDLAVMQPYYPLDANGDVEQLYVKENQSFFSADLAVEKSGKAVKIVDKLEISTMSISSYINFFIFDVNEQKARVDFTYSGVNNLLFWVYAEFKKNGENWEIVQLKSKEK